MATKQTTKTSAKTESIQIELIYALPNQQQLIQLEVVPDCSVKQAILQSGILEQYPEIDLENNKVGIFSQVCQLSDTLRDGDRIEIYRPLIIDPKEARKRRAEKKAKQKNKG